MYPASPQYVVMSIPNPTVYPHYPRVNQDSVYPSMNVILPYQHSYQTQNALNCNGNRGAYSIPLNNEASMTTSLTNTIAPNPPNRGYQYNGTAIKSETGMYPITDNSQLIVNPSAQHTLYHYQSHTTNAMPTIPPMTTTAFVPASNHTPTMTPSVATAAPLVLQRPMLSAAFLPSLDSIPIPPLGVSSLSTPSIYNTPLTTTHAVCVYESASNRVVNPQLLRQSTHVTTQTTTALQSSTMTNGLTQQSTAIQASPPTDQNVVQSFEPNSASHATTNHVTSSSLPQTNDNTRRMRYHLDNNACFKPDINADKPWHCPFENCEKIFGRKTYLEKHYRIHTDDAYICEFCQKKFARRSNKIEHLRTHTGEKPHRCHLCSRAFAQKHSLVDHIIGVHSKLKPFECDICHKSFSIKHNLKMHKEIHLPNRGYECEYCHKILQTKQSLKRHIRALHYDIIA